MTDTDAVALAQQGCEVAFRLLYDRHHSVVRGRCSKAFNNESDADDLTQDIFLKVWLKIRDFRADCAFSTWLHALTTNQIRDKIRKHSRSGQMIDLETIADIPTPPPQLLRLQLNDALAGLSEEDSSYLRAAVSGYRLSEIASRSRRSKCTVNKHLRGVRTQIKQEVG
jgi:RNA polymerase sigma-70 factor (ECF subfamily)